MEPREVFDVMEAEASAAEAFLERLPTEGLDEPSPCQGWSVGDVLAHLTLGSRAYISRIRRALGEISPTQRRTSGPGRELIASEARRIRIEAGAALTENFKLGNAELAAFFRGLSPENLNAKLRVAGLDTGAWFFAALRVAELSIHGWDIRRSFDAYVRLSEPAATVLADVHLPLFVALAVRPAEHELRDGHFRFDLFGPARTLGLRLEAGAPTLAPVSPSADADAALGMAAADFALLLYGRVGYDALLEEGRLSVEGDFGLAAAFGRLCRGI